MSKFNLPPEFAWLERGINDLFPHQSESTDANENLIARLRQCDRPLRVKLGIDPTAGDIHLGHSIPFRKLRAFQDAGHTAVLIIGDFTAQIGDPTGKSEVRRQLTPEEVKNNAQDYLTQLRPILDFDTPGSLEIRYNSEWLRTLDLSKISELLSTMTVGQMLAKEGFAERYTKETPIFLHEFLYPLMQGYDSVAVAADVELGGTDQKFNIAVGRDLQRHFGLTPQFGLLMPILLGVNGKQKMSKSLGNYVGLKENALSMYQKLQNIPDVIIREYFELLTNIPLDQLPEEPRQCQKQLALEIVSQYHGQEKALQAKETAENVVLQAKTQGESLPEFPLEKIQFPAPLSYILGACQLCASSSEGRRQIEGGAVRLEGQQFKDVNYKFNSITELKGKVLQVGKKKMIRLV